MGIWASSEATDSAKADQFRQRAGSRHYSVKGRDLYLSHEPSEIACNPQKRMAPQVGFEFALKRSFNKMQVSG
jgi:hypothetical protein